MLLMHLSWLAWYQAQLSDVAADARVSRRVTKLRSEKGIKKGKGK